MLLSRCFPADLQSPSKLLASIADPGTKLAGEGWIEIPLPLGTLFSHTSCWKLRATCLKPRLAQKVPLMVEKRFLCRAPNVLPEQSHRWQYVVFTELFPQVNLLILAESERISFPCSYNALRMRTPKSMEKARKAFLPEHRQTELEMQNPSVLYRIVCPLSQG